MIDFQSFLIEVEKAYSQKLPFVAYRKPNETTVKAIIQNDDELHTVNEDASVGFVFAPFDTNEKSILIPLKDSSCFEALVEITHITLDENISELLNENNKKAHIDLVTKGIDFITAGKAEKIVLSRKETHCLTDFSVFETFKKLLYTYTNAFVYVWYHSKVGFWLGATPEKLISLRGKEFSTVSLAGTQPYIHTTAVEWETKEIEEQQLVTNYIQSNLESIVNEVSIGKSMTVKAGNLLHLKTNIKGSLKNENDLHLIVNQLHPTPATCGLPKDVAKQFILENEDYNREFYTGFLGEINIQNTTNLFVNLRCMKVEANKVSLFLGGGITKDSIAENEWQETVEKSKVMKKVLPN